ncbi:MAG: hypothetical protein KME20_16800 [Kaiparowitsia implicata GSE-PSE-MK54-09C]|jgi:hypothetical protein|nr:hypothetical protein [Kaiparowitsia implicata GSE-PSE-MK54-09C]
MSNTITVTTTADSGAGSLRTAIANATSGTTIQFAASLANQTIRLTSGQLSVSVGKNLTIDGSAASNLTISGNNQSRIFFLNSTSVNPTGLIVKNLTLANGYTSDRGGAISTTHQGKLTVDNVKFFDNVADQGGGAIFSAFEGALTVVSSEFRRNKAIAGNDERGAGAIAFWGPGPLTVLGSKFINNQGINGGAINSLNGKLTIRNTQFLNNSTLAGTLDSGNANPSLRGYGGALYTDRASSTSEPSGFIEITGSIFQGNQGRAEGGAAYLFTGSQDRVTVSNTLFQDNQVQALSGGNGGNGGALTVLSNQVNRGLILTNTSFTGNRATGQGGGLWMMNAPMTLTNSTFSGNQVVGTGFSNVGGGMALYGAATITNTTIALNQAGWVAGGIAANSDPVTVRNSIFFNNSAANGGNDWQIQQQTNKELNDGGGNLQFPGYLSNQSNRFNDNLAVQNILIANPQLGALQSGNGSFLLFHPLLAGSPAIDDGVNNGAPTVDKLGNQRDSQTDIGAIEFLGTSTPPPTPPPTSPPPSSGLNRIDGTGGRDILTGTAGKDIIRGFAGRDVLIGGRSGDILVGGAGADRFVYSGMSRRDAFTDSLVRDPDHIRDLNVLQGDRIQLDFDRNLNTIERPRALSNAGAVDGKNLVEATRNAYADKNQVVAGAQPLRQFEAVMFAWGQGTYISANDKFGAFNPIGDLVVSITGATLPSNHLSAGRLSVDTYFA